MSSPMMISVLPSCTTLLSLSPTVGTEELRAGIHAARWRGCRQDAQGQARQCPGGLCAQVGCDSRGL